MSAIVKRSVSIRGHRTSFSLERPFLEEIERIAAERGLPLARLVAEVDAARADEGNLSSALRLYVLDWYRRKYGDSLLNSPGMPMKIGGACARIK